MRVDIPYSEISQFPVSTAPTHAGNLIFAKSNGLPIAILQGRCHLYEGYSAQETTLGVYLLNQLGADQLLITNAAGGLNSDYKVGDVMMIDDHLNLTGQNPLIGPPNDLGPRFPDRSSLEVRVQRKGAGSLPGHKVTDPVVGPDRV